MWLQIWKWKTRDSCLCLAMLMSKSRFFRHIKCIKWTSFHTKQELASVKNSVPARTHRLCKITKKNWAVFQTAQNGSQPRHTIQIYLQLSWCDAIFGAMVRNIFFVVLYCFPVRHKRPFLCLKIHMLFRFFTSSSLGVEHFCFSAD